MKNCIYIILWKMQDFINNNFNDENIENIQSILRKYEQNDTIFIDNIKSTLGSNAGDNYMSVVTRIHITGKSNKNKNYQRILIVKRKLCSLARRQLFRCDEAFANEIAAYCSLVPAFRMFSYNSLPIPNCLFAGTDKMGDIIILEDMRQSGYKMANRLEGLDYDHCKLVMQELGKFHAISLVMKNQAPKEFQEATNKVKDIVYCKEAAEFYTKSLDSSLRSALSSLRLTNRNHDLDISIEQISKLSGRMYKIMSRNILENSDNWSVMCHGDLWINNLLFRYDDCDRVNGVKFIDLQTVRYASPVIDILHFIFTSTQEDLRKNYFDKLLMDYTNAVNVGVRNLKASSEFIEEIKSLYTVENVRKQFNLKVLYGLGISMWLLPAVTFYSNNIPDLDSIKLTDFTNKKQDKRMASMQTPEYHDRMKAIALEFSKKGYLNDIII